MTYLFHKNICYVASVDMAETTQLSGFLIKLATIKSSKIILIDGDQCGYSLACLNWIYKNNDIRPDYHIFVVTGQEFKLDEHFVKYDFVTHIESHNQWRDSADFVLCSLLNQAYAYSLLYKISYAYTLISNDHFIFNAWDEFRAVGQAIEIVDPKSSRLDLFMLSITSADYLSDKGQKMNDLLQSLEYRDIDSQSQIDSIFDGFELRQNLKSHHLLIELERKGKGITLPTLMDSTDNFVERDNPSDLQIFIESNEQLRQIKDYLVNRRKINVCQLGNYYPMSIENKSRFKVKTWYQLLKQNPCVLKWLHAEFETTKGVSFICLKNVENSSYDDDLRIMWQTGWKLSSKLFCDEYHIYENEFVAWIQKKRPINHSATYAIKKWISSKAT